MNSFPRVCIMIPTYNQANFITKAVESALAQDYPNTEIVIADDCSTDNTEEIVQPYLIHAKIKYIKNSANIGRVANYRKCLYEYTTADWVINLDGDDYYTNRHFISEAMEAIKKIGENKMLFYQGMHTCLHDGREDFLPTNLEKNEELLDGAAYFFGYFKRLHFSHMSTLYNRNLALQSGFFTENILSADIFSFLKLCIENTSQQVIASKTISGVWVQHDSNHSQTAQIKPHFKNMLAFNKLYKLALHKGFSKPQSIKWLRRAWYIYLRTFAGTIIRKLK